MCVKLGQFPLSLLVDYNMYEVNGLLSRLTNARSTFFSLKKKSLILEISSIEMPPSCCRFAVSLQAFHAMLALLLATSGLLPFTTQLIGLAVGQHIVSDFVSRWDWCVMMGGLREGLLLVCWELLAVIGMAFFFFFLREGCNKTIVLKIELNN